MNETTIKAVLRNTFLSAVKARFYATEDKQQYFQGQMDLSEQLFLSLFNEKIRQEEK